MPFVSIHDLQSDISHHIWDLKYRYADGEKIFDRTIEETWRRVAKALASTEAQDQFSWEKKFYEAMEDYKFLPGGRILAGAGTDRRVTLLNCFVMGKIEDSMTGIFEGLKEGALTMQQGGGVGYDFSTLRPKGMEARGAGTIASGPVSFMKVWDAMCATLISTGVRRGAMMATLRCDHPDIEEFVEAKRDRRALRHFNLSVLVTDKFMQAVESDAAWPLVFKSQTVRSVSARELWDRILRSAYDCAEPGVLFIDRINRMNNLWYREDISATNPCGEIPLPPYGACDLGSINLTKFVKNPFSEKATVDLDGIAATSAMAVRMLDDVIDLSRFPLPAQKMMAQRTRRVGLGVTGLADLFLMTGMTYGSPQSLGTAADILKTIVQVAYETSVDLAKEKGCFPFLEKEGFLEGEFVSGLPERILKGIEKQGIRNSHLIAIAPAGTISLLAGNVSSGIEPVFAFQQERRLLEKDGRFVSCELSDYAWRLWRQGHAADELLPVHFIEAHALPPQTHLDMAAAVAPYVDHAVSKTINIPKNFDFDAFRAVYGLAHEKGLKGCTVFRPNAVTGEILSAIKEEMEEPVCCPA